MGFTTYLTGNHLSSKQGPQYKNIKAIIWDECNSTKGQFSITQKELRKFIIFCSSVIRDKKDVKIYMFGNLLRNDDGTTSNLILEEMGIDPAITLKKIDFPSADGSEITTMLYINTTKHYQGVESQKIIGMFQGGKIQADLESNAPESANRKFVDPNIFMSAKPVFAFVFTYEAEVYALYLGELYNEGVPHYAVRIELYNHQKTYGYKPITGEAAIANSFYPRMNLAHKEILVETVLYGLYSVTLSNNL